MKKRILTLALLIAITLPLIFHVVAKPAFAQSKVSKPDYGAILMDYKTRSNCFIVSFKNNGNKKLTITSGIKVTNNDYKSFDRKIRLKKKVVIKPGKTKEVKFYVKGRTTWYDSEEFKLYYNFKYSGKTYKGKVYFNDDYDEYFFTRYKKGSKWKDTYSGGEDSWFWDWVEYEY